MGEARIGSERLATYLLRMLPTALRDTIPLSDDPKAKRRPNPKPPAPPAIVAADREALAERARESFLALPWDTRYERTDIEQLAAKAAIALTDAELVAHVHAGRREIICYSESGEEFTVKQLRPGKRHIEILGDAFAQVELPRHTRDADDIYCRVIGEARAFVLSGTVYAEHQAHVEAGANAYVSLFDAASGVVDAMGAFAYGCSQTRIELKRAHQVRAADEAVVLVDPAKSRGQIALCDQAQIVDVHTGATLVTALELLEGENTVGNARWLRREELTCYHWAWNR